MTAIPATSIDNFQTPNLRRRLASLLYESLLLFGVGLISGFIGTVALKAAGVTAAAQYHVVMQIVGVLVYGAYFVGFWAHRGQTLAMQTWHIKLVTGNGGRVSTARALARYVCGYLWIAPGYLLAAVNHWSAVSTLVSVGVGLVIYALLALLHPQRQFWHDALCGTRLITQRTPAKSSA